MITKLFLAWRILKRVHAVFSSLDVQRDGKDWSFTWRKGSRVRTLTVNRDGVKLSQSCGAFAKITMSVEF